jgi:hypothetical protein
VRQIPPLLAAWRGMQRPCSARVLRSMYTAWTHDTSSISALLAFIVANTLGKGATACSRQYTKRRPHMLQTQRAAAALQRPADAAGSSILITCRNLAWCTCRRRPQRCRVPALHPLSRPALFYVAFITLVDATYTAFVVPIGIAFQYQVDTFTWFNAVDIAGGESQPLYTPFIGLSMSCR